MSSKYKINFEKIKKDYGTVTRFCRKLQLKDSTRQEIYQIHNKTRLNSDNKNNLFELLKDMGYASRVEVLQIKS